MNVKEHVMNALGWFKQRLVNSIVNNCTSTSTTLPLAAAQGKVLQDQITTLNTNKITKSSFEKFGDIYFINDLVLPVSNILGHIPATHICIQWHETLGFCLGVYYIYNGKRCKAYIKVSEINEDV